MDTPTLTDIQALIEELILPFYDLERDMLLPPHFNRNENDAEHSWSVAFFACALAIHIDPSLNLGLVSQFAIVHDLVEVGAGDTSVWAASEERGTKEDREKQALQEMEQRYAHLPWITETIRQYEKKELPEAKYVWAMDKFLALFIRYLDKGTFFHQRGITKEIFDAHIAPAAKKTAAHPGVYDYYKKLLALYASHPEYFAIKKD